MAEKASVRIIRGGSGKWIATYRTVRIASGHVPARIGNWQEIVRRQLARQARGEEDPRQKLGGGMAESIEVPTWVLEGLMDRLHREQAEKERVQAQRWRVTFEPLEEGLLEIPAETATGSSSYAVRRDAEFSKGINEVTIRGKIENPYKITVTAI